MSENANPYDATHITVLEGWEAVRQRPGMYVGSTGERGLHQAVFEVVGRAVNEVLAGRASSVDVTLTPDGGVTVADDGQGVPVEVTDDVDGAVDLAGAEPADRNTAAVGLVGIGPSITNALSSRLTAEVRRDGARWVQEYARGVAAAPPTAVGAASGSGTTITFRPDSDIFETVECSFAVLAERFRELAFLNRGLAISLTDARPPGEPRSVRFLGGTRDFVGLTAVVSVKLDHPSFEGATRGVLGNAAVRTCFDETVRERLGSWLEGHPEQAAAVVDRLTRDAGRS